MIKVYEYANGDKVWLNDVLENPPLSPPIQIFHRIFRVETTQEEGSEASIPLFVTFPL